MSKIKQLLQDQVASIQYHDDAYQHLNNIQVTYTIENGNETE